MLDLYECLTEVKQCVRQVSFHLSEREGKRLWRSYYVVEKAIDQFADSLREEEEIELIRQNVKLALFGAGAMLGILAGALIERWW